jgi:lipopolysaccharide export system permease protein
MEARRGGINPAIILKMVPFILPQALVYAIPATVLLAVCVVYGRISSSNEIVALKSLGITPWQMVWPTYALAFVLSLICVYLNDIAFSWGEVGVKRVIIQSVEEIVYGTLQTHRTYSNDRFSISVAEIEGRRLIGIYIDFFASGESPAFSVSAEEAELRSNLENNTLRLILLNSKIDGGGSLQGVFPGRTEREVPLSFASKKNDADIVASQLPLRDIPEAITQQQQTIRTQKQALAAEAGMSLIGGDLLDLNETRWKIKRQLLQQQLNRLYRLQIEPWRRTASGFMCLCFAVVGVPFAIQRRNADYVSNFGMCFIPIVFCYFPLFGACLNYAKAGSWPAFTIWLANVVCMFIGWRLWRAVERY